MSATTRLSKPASKEKDTPTSKNDVHAKMEPYIAQGHTPMMAQYHMLKEEHSDCLMFYRMGDFYELFYNDAITAADVLGITLTKRGKSNGDDIAMCGVPYHSYEPYLAKLIRAGHKVAVCEQTETPDEAKARAKREGRPASKSLVNREAVRIITQGTLTEDNLLDARAHNYLCCISSVSGAYGGAWIDLSTGEFMVQPVSQQELRSMVERIDPREILISDQTKITMRDMLESIGTSITSQDDTLFDSQNAGRHLQNLFNVETLESFGDFTRAEISAAGSLIDYILRTQKGKTPHIATPRRITSDDVMDIDAATRKNLELIRTLAGERKGSLLDCLDATVTSAGSRLLQSRLSAPLANIHAINTRLDHVDAFLKNAPLRGIIREFLRGVPDMERALSRITIGRGGPKDLCMIRDGLIQSEIIRAELQNDTQTLEILKSNLHAMQQVPALAALQDKLRLSLEDNVPHLARDGGFIRAGFAAKLDELRSLKEDSRTHIAALQGKYQKETRISSLKIKHNNVLGYFIDVSAKYADAMMVKEGEANPFVHRQTLANAVRFTTPELSELERDISSASEKIIAIELDIFATLTQQTSALANDIGVIAQTIAALDVSSALAQLAEDMGYTRPIIDETKRFDIIEGRHPVVEHVLKSQAEPFIPNNCDLSTDRLWLLTGPNMAGKSTFLRQNALIAIMAHIGSFVPATSAHIGVIDKCFSRVGASDDLARGQSTFMVEMVETATILNQSTDRSLVILDEIGRGTATYDGLSIAWACVEYLHEQSQCRALFATHYHELTTLEKRLNALACHTVQVKEWDDNVIFMHKVIKGNANKSYGIHVAQLAGLPANVIQRAEEILLKLSATDAAAEKGKMLDDMPLFNLSAPAEAPKTSLAETALKDINPDDLSPKDALNALYHLKTLLD